MGQTLDLIPVPGATPIANNSTSAKTFASDYFKLSVPNLSTRDRKTIWILGLIYELAHNGGANYKTNHKQLQQDAQVYTSGIMQFDLIAGSAADAWSAGNTADATLTNSIPGLLALAPAISQQAEDQLDRIIVFLRAQLNV